MSSSKIFKWLLQLTGIVQKKNIYISPMIMCFVWSSIDVPCYKKYRRIFKPFFEILHFLLNVGVYSQQWQKYSQKILTEELKIARRIHSVYPDE